MKRVLVYIGLTVLYVTVMDTFTDYQANQAIIRLAILSILILALNTYLNGSLKTTNNKFVEMDD